MSSRDQGSLEEYVGLVALRSEKRSRLWEILFSSFHSGTNITV